jgi:uncharacterized membrane protein
MGRFLLTIFMILALPTAASSDDRADNLPALFDVTGVVPPDVLNVRAEPTAAADTVGTIESDAQRIEVVGLSDDGRWGVVNLAETSGYVAMRFLRRRAVETGAEGLPARLACFGTEPFWSLSWRDGELSLSTPEDSERSLSLDRVLPIINAPQPNHVLLAHDGEARFTGVVGRAECSDGMSDRRYGLAITLIEDSASGWAAGGCCSLR